MELNDFFPIDSKLSIEENLSQQYCEINNGAIFNWNMGWYAKKILDTIIDGLKKYGIEYSINDVKSTKFVIFTKAYDFKELILKKEQHFIFFLDDKELEEHSYLKSFFYYNETIDYNLLAECFIENGVWSDIEKLPEYMKNLLKWFKENQQKYNLNPSYLFEAKDEESAKFVQKIFNKQIEKSSKK